MKNSEGGSSLTGWSATDKDNAGFTSNRKHKEQKTPPGMVLIEGGTFTMGGVQDDVMFDWNTTPTKQQVRSFYMDETEVTNNEYMFYLEYMERLYPPSELNYKDIYHSAIPDTLVWREVLGSNELLTENYLRHPAYSKYPVVGVSWLQANQYCKWRTDIVNERILIDKKLIRNSYEKISDSVVTDNNRRFDTQAYLSNPNDYYRTDTISGEDKEGFLARKVNETTVPSVGVSNGILMPSFRLPTEAEWEFAAKSITGNRKWNNIEGRKKYSWNGKYTRIGGGKAKGDQLTNFKQGKGDYSGLAGWSNDGADITNAVKSYKPNAYGLYDMSGNVAEWVADVYRPIIDSNDSDFNYFRGNVFMKKSIGEDGIAVIVDDASVKFDTLDNGRLIPKALPGSVQYEPVSISDVYMRKNYDRANNINYRDGDLQSTKHYRKDELDQKTRMYNSPVKDRQIGEGGLLIQNYDTKKRYTLVSDKSRVYKGGSWRDREYWLDPSQRRYLPEYMSTNYIGFRCSTDRLGPMKSAKTTKKKITN